MLLQREIRLQFKGFLIVTVICAALSLYMIVLIPSMGADMKSLLDMKLPHQMQAAFGMDKLDFGRPMGTYAIMFSYLYLTFAIYAASTCARIVSKEFADKTAEYLFSLPARRIDIILTKLGVAVGYLTASVGITFLLSWIGFALVIHTGYDVGPLLLMSLAQWLGALFFGALAYLFSSYYVKARLAAGIVLIAYLLQVVISLKGNLDWLKYISPFDWFKGSDIVNGGELSLAHLLIALVATVACFVWGTRQFLRKDVLV